MIKPMVSLSDTPAKKKRTLWAAPRDEDVRYGRPLCSSFVLTHCNGASGYLITDQAYTEGGCEVLPPGQCRELKS